MEKIITLAGTVTVTEMVKMVISTYIKPKLTSFIESNELAEQFYIPTEEKFEQYINRNYKRYIMMNTIVFKNQQKTIDDLYIPLTIEKVNTNPQDEPIYITIDKFTDELIPNFKKVLLVDNAGMGKSTIVKYLYIASIKQNKGIPILIELRKLDKNSSLIDVIMNELDGIDQYFEKKYVLELIERGDFIFFLDGYDEITEEHKQEATKNLEEFISKADNNLFIISSRDESSLNCFGNFQRFEIKPLKREEAYALIRKYDNYGELSTELIKKLNNEENLKIINEFLTNPLMTSLLYKAFEYKGIVPYKKHIFYRQVYDALFEDHDRSKGGAYVHPKKSKLDIEDFHRILRSLGFSTLAKGKISYSKEELIKIILDIKHKNSGISFRENDFIYDLTHSVPLFVKDGIEYRWAHKSFQEYFAASYICYDTKEKQDILLAKMANHERISKYYNVLDFCYDIDYISFRKAVVYPVIEEFIDYFNNSYTNKEFRGYDKEQLGIRKSLTFMYGEMYIRKVKIGHQEKKEENEENEDPRTEFEEMFKNWKGLNSKRSQRLIYSGSIGVGVIRNMIDDQRFFSQNNSIMTLLNNKQSPIVKTHQIINTEEYTGLIELGEYFVNDDPNNILNNKEAFKDMNLFLLSFHQHLSGRGLLFDYNECMRFRNEIRNELSFEQEDIDLI